MKNFKEEELSIIDKIEFELYKNNIDLSSYCIVFDYSDKPLYEIKLMDMSKFNFYDGLNMQNEKTTYHNMPIFSKYN
jgi:hypothetical protein